jgi:Contractile injection system tube protein
MPQPQTLAKAQLIETDAQGNVKSGGKTVPVQFNPQTLKLNYSNTFGSGNQPQGSSTQFVGTSTTKLSMELWFDVTLPAPDGLPDAGGDVRKWSQLITYFMTVQNPNAQQQESRVPPNMKFQWGSFLFNGTMDTVDETIDLFSPDGVPLRSNISVSISKHDLNFEFAQAGGPQSAGSGVAAGTSPLTTANAGDSLSQMAAKAGISNWQGVAQANGITNPRLLQAGTMINLSITV